MHIFEIMCTKKALKLIWWIYIFSENLFCILTIEISGIMKQQAYVEFTTHKFASNFNFNFLILVNRKFEFKFTKKWKIQQIQTLHYKTKYFQGNKRMMQNFFKMANRKLRKSEISNFNSCLQISKFANAF